uniref:STAR-like protein n=1 Tax=Hofstenia miamia TaxID=442651 RepID=A0A5P8I4M2_HOFMI|nr:STAR-like protein [Hofstenia miamia]
MDCSIDRHWKVVADALSQFDVLPEWNKTLSEIRTLTTLPGGVEINYQKSAASIVGLISCRDFVVASKRVCDQTLNDGKGMYLDLLQSVPWASCPETKGAVRGEHRLMAIRVTGVDENHCEYCLLNSTDPKGWIPTAVVEKAFAGALLEQLDFLMAKFPPK